MRQLLGFGVAPTSKNQNPKELPLAWADPSPFIGHTLSFITSGVDRVAAVTCEGKVFLWGRFYDAENEEESEKFTEIPSPTLFHFSANVIVTQIALGESFTVALSDNGHVFSWGCGYHGQLGHGDVRDSHEPRQIHSLNGKNVVQIVCGKTHSMARTGGFYIPFFILHMPGHRIGSKNEGKKKEGKKDNKSDGKRCASVISHHPSSFPSFSLLSLPFISSFFFRSKR
eukprot:TRINITY_DN2423_c0_g2_i8.p1 TRINITY_DN2423_c0_g2~~TRINITY_DN2423_c0_g2_i8.p1  ORF type:complete len:227 (+),score=28.93 TRINITY_DN2423_c0_g2_i8:87-767(+)